MESCKVCGLSTDTMDKQCDRCSTRVHFECMSEAPRRTDRFLCDTCSLVSRECVEEDVQEFPPQAVTVAPSPQRLAAEARGSVQVLETMIGQLMEQSEIQERRFAMREAAFEMLLQRTLEQVRVEAVIARGEASSPTSPVQKEDHEEGASGVRSVACDRQETERTARAAAAAVKVQHCPTLPSANNNNVNKTVERTANVVLSASSWKDRLPQSLLASALATKPLTKEQIARRKMGTELPVFDGDAFTWLKFVKKYLETAGDMCGFTTTEDMERVRVALRNPAKALVSAYMENPDNLDRVMDSLQNNYGHPSILVDAAYNRAQKLPALRDDLSNLASFCSEVDQLRVITHMDPANPLGSALVKTLERKLSDDYAERWLDIRGLHDTGSMDQMADFLLERQARRIHLRRGQGDKAPKPKTVLATQDTPLNHFHGETTPQSQPPKVGCKLRCETPHKLSICPRFRDLPIRARWHKVRRFKICVRCLDRHPKEHCRSEAKCNVGDCKMDHHPLLHPRGVTIEKTLNLAHSNHKETFFPIVSTMVHGPNGSRRVSLLMDSGSSVTLVDAQLATELGLSGKESLLALSWADGNLQPTRTTKTVSFEVEGTTGNRFQLRGKTYHNLTLPRSQVTRELLEAEGLQHLPIVCNGSPTPLILIGQDNGEIKRSLSSTLGKSRRVYASLTPLGYTVEGEADALQEMERAACLMIREQVCLAARDDGRLHKMVQDFIDVEHFGLGPDGDVVLESDENKQAREMMIKCTQQRDDRHFETSLLWKDAEVQLPNNHAEVKRRHMNWERSLWKDPVKARKVGELMQSYLAKGYIRPVASAATTPNRVWYLPVFTVTNPMKPEKVRLVWDCAAKFRSVSLNSVLTSGPDLTNPLVNVLQYFRRGRFAITGDLEEMFHQVGVREQDRAAQRFFFRFNQEEELREYEMCVLTFGSTCSPTLAQFVKNLNAARFQDEYSEATKAIIERHYVDDYLDSEHSEEELLVRAQQVRDIHREGGFRMHKLQANSDVVMSGLGEKRPPGIEVSLSNSTILGMLWNLSNDCLSFRFARDRFRPALMNGSAAPTKREMLRIAMSIYDPLGLVSYLTIEAKLLIRDAWSCGADWDDELDIGIQRRWAKWTSYLSALDDITIPRWHGTQQGNVTLHVFVDASEGSICATCYVVQETAEGRVRSLIMTKCLLAPLKTKSIPRLELDAALLGVRLVKMVRAANAWPVEKTVFWTDAKDVLFWLKSSTRRYSTYVGNRVAHILHESEVDQWRWVPTECNPADWGTKWSERRGEAELWWYGPEFLANDEEDWPSFELGPHQLLEVRPILLATVHVPLPGIVPDVSRFSTWAVLLKTCALIAKFIDIMRQKKYPGPLTAEDLQLGEAALFREAQQTITNNKKYTAFLSSLAPFYDQHGVMRMRGRSSRSAHLPYDARFPVILPDDHPITTLLIQHYHRHGNHQNTTTVMNELRTKVRMPNMRATIRRVIANCRLCAIRRTKPVYPQMGALPPCRMAIYMPPFSFVGLDYFGPIDVAIGRRREKRWGVLFTCMTTRAVYLELVNSLSTSSCLAALDSLVARRGLPREIHSDNATCFVGASKLYQGPNGQKVKWVFIPPNTPSMGGAWERLVGVCKAALDNLQLDKAPQEEALRRALLQVERLMNTRPLTDIPVDHEEEECLTPNHFLLGSTNGLKPEGRLEDWSPKDALEEWERITALFWDRWICGHLPNISARPKWKKEVDPVRVDDLVYICDQDHRIGWRRGRVVEATMDRESGQVRQVIVETADGKRYRRGVCKIAPILRPDPQKVDEGRLPPAEDSAQDYEEEEVVISNIAPRP